jgi:hypothetical protein
MPDKPRIRHLKRVEDQPAREILKRFSGDRLDHPLQIEVALSRIAEPVSRRKMRA